MLIYILIVIIIILVGLNLHGVFSKETINREGYYTSNVFPYNNDTKANTSGCSSSCSLNGNTKYISDYTVFEKADDCRDFNKIGSDESSYSSVCKRPKKANIKKEITENDKAYANRLYAEQTIDPKDRAAVSSIIDKILPVGETNNNDENLDKNTPFKFEKIMEGIQANIKPKKKSVSFDLAHTTITDGYS